jgi:hypothetical protein
MMTQITNFRKHLRLIGGVAVTLSSATALPAQVTQVDYAALTGTEFISFAGVTGGPSPGTNYNGVIVVGGVAFGERFDGQMLTAAGNFDQLSGTPSNGLTLLAGANGQNLAFFQSPAGQVLSGIGPAGFPVPDAIGEGVVSLLFSSDQSEFGFRLAGGHNGTANVGFFRADGSLIQTIALGNLPLTASYGFTRNAGIMDIRGISIWNDDLTGIGLAGLRHNVQSAIPEPSTWAMMIGGFGLMGIAMRRRRRCLQPIHF